MNQNRTTRFTLTPEYLDLHGEEGVERLIRSWQKRVCADFGWQDAKATFWPARPRLGGGAADSWRDFLGAEACAVHFSEIQS